MVKNLERAQSLTFSLKLTPLSERIPFIFFLYHFQHLGIQPSSYPKSLSYTIWMGYKGLRGAPQEAVIKYLNPIIRGWSQYYISVVSSKIFGLLDNAMHEKLWKWAVFRHHNKGRRWVKRKYFKKYGNDNWKYIANIDKVSQILDK